MSDSQPAEPASLQILEPAEECAAFLYLGNMYRTLGLLDQAYAEYTRAHAVHPSDETAKALAALRHQIAAQKPSTAAASIRSAA